MTDKIRAFILVLAVILAYCAGSWTYLFWEVYTKGVAIVEPNKGIILAETIMAGVFTVVGIGVFCFVLRDYLKNG